MDTLTLYKYRALNEWCFDTLRSGKMWFSLPGALNDTFEFSVPLFVRLSAAAIVEHIETHFDIGSVAPELLAKMMENAGGDSIPITTEFVTEFLRTADSDSLCLYFSAVVHFLREQGLSTQGIIEALRLDEESVLRSRLEHELRRAYDRNQAFGRGCGVLSLAARHDDPRMWAHYADSCRGVCIGMTFDVDDLVNSDFVPLWVRYSEELPRVDAGRFFDPKRENVLEMLTLFYATKHLAWEYEREFRLISMQGDVALNVPGRISSVILGEKAEEADASRVHEILVGLDDGIEFCRMMRDPGTWNYRAYGCAVSPPHGNPRPPAR